MAIPNPGFSVTRIECKESRIGKKPVTVPKGVTASLENQTLRVKGPLGELTQNYPREIKLQYDPSGIITVSRAMDTRKAQQMHGLFRCGLFISVLFTSYACVFFFQCCGVGNNVKLANSKLSLS